LARRHFVHSTAMKTTNFNLYSQNTPVWVKKCCQKVSFTKKRIFKTSQESFKHTQHASEGILSDF